MAKIIDLTETIKPVYEWADPICVNGVPINKPENWSLDIVYYSVKDWPKLLEVQRLIKWDDSIKDFTINIFLN